MSHAAKFKTLSCIKKKLRDQNITNFRETTLCTVEAKIKNCVWCVMYDACHVKICVRYGGASREHTYITHHVKIRAQDTHLTFYT